LQICTIGLWSLCLPQQCPWLYNARFKQIILFFIFSLSLYFSEFCSVGPIFALLLLLDKFNQMGNLCVFFYIFRRLNIFDARRAPIWLVAFALFCAPHSSKHWPDVHFLSDKSMGKVRCLCVLFFLFQVWPICCRHFHSIPFDLRFPPLFIGFVPEGLKRSFISFRGHLPSISNFQFGRTPVCFLLVGIPFQPFSENLGFSVAFYNLYFLLLIISVLDLAKF
jgi:hypothetical protein